MLKMEGPNFYSEDNKAGQELDHVKHPAYYTS